MPFRRAPNCATGPFDVRRAMCDVRGGDAGTNAAPNVQLYRTPAGRANSGSGLSLTVSMRTLARGGGTLGLTLLVAALAPALPSAIDLERAKVIGDLAVMGCGRIAVVFLK